MADAPYQRHTGGASALLALACLLLCGLALAGWPVPSWAGWLATAITNGVIALEKLALLRRGRP